MERLERAAVIAELAEKLQQNESWCGETHLQKAAYLLQEALGVPLDFDFVLYKRGPFSFDLRDELTGMRADGLLEVRPHEPPYGPSLDPTEASKRLRVRLGRALREVEAQIDFVAQRLGPSSASELERFATAYYVLRKDLPGGSVDERVERITELKPYVTAERATAALAEVEQMRDEAARQGLTFAM
jgi:uncharacterized protein YwgA